MKIKWVRKGLIAAAVILILAGLFRHDAVDVMNKAVRICYEGIGIG